MALSYYDILGLTQDAQETEIRRAYRRAVKEYHPDLHPDDEKSARRSRELNQALETLLDPKKRERYDRLLKRRQKKSSDKSTATRTDSAEKSDARDSAAAESQEKASEAKPRDFSFPFSDSLRPQDAAASKGREQGWSELPPFEEETYVEPPASDDLDVSKQEVDPFFDATSPRATSPGATSQGATSPGAKPSKSPQPHPAYRTARRPRKATNHSLWLGVGLGVTGATVLVVVVLIVGTGLWWFSNSNGAARTFATGPASRMPRGPGERLPSVGRGHTNRSGLMRKNPVSQDLLESIPMPNGKRPIDFTTAEGQPISAPAGIQLLQFPGVNTTRAFEFRLKVQRVAGNGSLVIGTPIMGQTVAVTLDQLDDTGYVTGIDQVRQRGRSEPQFHVMGRGQLCPSGRELEIVIRAAMVGPMREIQLRVEGRELGTFQYRPTDLQPQGEISDLASTSVYIATRDAQFRIEAFDYVR